MEHFVWRIVFPVNRITKEVFHVKIGLEKMRYGGTVMKKKYDVVALGELLIDFTEAGIGADGMRMFEQNPGGAPANLLTAVSHMGHQTAFIGKVGKDMHGDFLKQTLQKEGICTDYLLQDEKVFTTLAFVALGKNGEREFSFARKPGADTCLSVEELPYELLQNCRIFHIGSLSLTDEPIKSATFEAVKKAKEAGAIISYDPNYRESLWESKEQAMQAMLSLVPYADMVKVSEEEGELLTGEKDCVKAARKLLAMGPSLIAVTMGEQGVHLVKEEWEEQIPGFCVNAVDTTGAGDSFWGGFLSCFLEYEKAVSKIENSQWKDCATRGNVIAALCVGRRGGIPAIPSKQEVEQFGK